MTTADWNTIRQFNTRRFTVALQYVPDADADYDGDGMAYVFRVVVLCDGLELATDYLGESVYYDPGDFAREHLGHNHQLGRAYFPDMLRAATVEARKTLAHAPRMRVPGLRTMRIIEELES